jgi:dipeptidyl aminopeptidase/acylaminoacyl peptidase
VLLGNPERAEPRLSPDGNRIAYLAPDGKNVMQVWVRSWAGGDDQLVTTEPKRGVRSFSWSEDSAAVLYEQDKDGDENFHLYLAELGTRKSRDLTPFTGVRAKLLGTHPKFPDQALIAMNQRDARVFDVHRIALKTGALTLDTKNPGDVESWEVDPNFVVRGATANTPAGGLELRVRDNAKAIWKSVLKVGPEESLTLHGFSADGRDIWVSTSLGAEFDRLLRKNTVTGVQRVVSTHASLDALEVLSHPSRYVVQAVAYDADGRKDWRVLDSSVEGDFAELRKVSLGEFSLVSRDAQDRRWVVAYESDRTALRYFTWDRGEHRSAFLFAKRPKLSGYALAEMKPIRFSARDGRALTGYVSSAAGKTGPRPMVVLVRAHPWERERWGIAPVVQFLANRGYTVLQVNFRGSFGYGKRFRQAGDRQWGRQMQDDLIDGAQWAMQRGMADVNRVAIMGTGYGGYATLMGLSATPDYFRCGVAFDGPSNLASWLKSFPTYWTAKKPMLAVRIGDADDAREASVLKEVSPVFLANQMQAPLLIGHGVNDVRVRILETEQMVAALEKTKVPFTYVAYPDEGFELHRAENRIDFFGRAEVFLAACLGGQAEAWPSSGGIAGSSAQVRKAPK